MGETFVHTREDGYIVSDDAARIDLPYVHRFLSEDSYWGKGIPFETVRRAAANSMCFGIYDPNGKQVGFARVVSDRAVYGYLADVFVDKTLRGRGLSKFLMEAILAHPDLQGLRRFALATRDAQGLYAQFGFKALERPENRMERDKPGIYLTATKQEQP